MYDVPDMNKCGKAGWVMRFVECACVRVCAHVWLYLLSKFYLCTEMISGKMLIDSNSSRSRLMSSKQVDY